MPVRLTEGQRKLAHHVLLFDRPLGHEVAEALRRATLASAENRVASTGISEFLCGLYLQFGRELQVHFDGELVAMAGCVFPKHRFGDKGLVPEKVLESAASDGDSIASHIQSCCRIASYDPTTASPNTTFPASE
jgi:hypothetical protein